MAEWLADLARNLGENLVSLREKRGLSQAALARLCHVPRSTIAHIESGSGNPSLANLAKLSAALQATVEELLSRPRALCTLTPASEVRAQKRNQATLFKLLPDPIPGMEIDRLELDRGGRMGGTPHVMGTKEYMTCVQGEVTVIVSGERYRVRVGDVFAFPGDQPHSYHNTGIGKAICFSVVAFAQKLPLRLD